MGDGLFPAEKIASLRLVVMENITFCLIVLDKDVLSIPLLITVLMIVFF